MLDVKRREFIALIGGGGLLLAAKVMRPRAEQPAMPVVGFKLRRQYSGFLPGGGNLHWPHPQGREAGRPAGPAGHKS